jgi:hypothetical protein
MSISLNLGLIICVIFWFLHFSECCLLNKGSAPWRNVWGTGVMAENRIAIARKRQTFPSAGLHVISPWYHSPSITDVSPQSYWQVRINSNPIAGQHRVMRERRGSNGGGREGGETHNGSTAKYANSVFVDYPLASIARMVLRLIIFATSIYQGCMASSSL